ncbi:hypothetical protein NUH87_06910 [Pseudomonas batumici]|uniref:hypothetical protein n=1 Tax=Pseudomonas batumici TaxID=226910 RepID=UPI0030CDCD28
MERVTYDLLYSLPAGADYAVDATDLDAEDIPQSRVDRVLDLLLGTNSGMEHFLAARLLTSWGYHEGLTALEKCMSDREGIDGAFAHRIHGYDDTYRQVLLAVIRYFSNVADRGDVDGAGAQVYGPLSKIISLASTMPFEISNVFDFVSREGFLEYIPLFEQHLLSIVDQPEVHRWKINDAIGFLLRFDSEFVLSLLTQRGQTVDSFKV